MIVVLATASDGGARRVVDRWGSRSAAILTVADLCRHGWSLRLPEATGTSVIDGRSVPNDAITGVLTLRSHVSPHELRSIRESDREYVSCELNAFLLAWLTSLRCRVVNRPNAASLSGPNWGIARWKAAASAVGFPGGASDECIDIHVAGERIFGCDDPTLSARCVALAKVTDVELLSVRVSRAGGDFVSATPFPPLVEPDFIDAVRAYVEGS